MPSARFANIFRNLSRLQDLSGNRPYFRVRVTATVRFNQARGRNDIVVDEHENIVAYWKRLNERPSCAHTWETAEPYAREMMNRNG